MKQLCVPRRNLRIAECRFWNEELTCSLGFQEKNPTQARYYERRGDLYKSKKYFELVMSDYEKMVRMKPEKKSYRKLFMELFERFSELPDGEN